MDNLSVITTTDSEDPDEMPHDEAFHQGLKVLLDKRRVT